jgi:hypothetical protein
MHRRGAKHPFHIPRASIATGCLPARPGGPLVGLCSTPAARNSKATTRSFFTVPRGIPEVRAPVDVLQVEGAESCR